MSFQTSIFVSKCPVKSSLVMLFQQMIEFLCFVAGLGGPDLVSVLFYKKFHEMGKL